MELTLTNFHHPTACRLVITLVALALVFGAVGCVDLPWDRTVEVETLTIGVERTAVNSLILIAASQKYFASNWLDVKIKEYPSGLAAVNGMMNQEVDLSTASEFVIVGKAFESERVRALASIDKFIHIYLVARKDRGIAVHMDLVGKKIGVPLKTAAEFYLGRFLELNGLSLEQVTLVNVAPPDFESALVNGEVDAVQAWQPYVKIIEDRMDGGIIAWPAQSEQASYAVLLGRDEWIKDHPQLVKRFLTALAQADDYIDNHPDESRDIIQKELALDPAYMDEIWPQHQFQLALDQSMIVAMEDEARWMIKNHLTPSTQTPVFLDYIDADGLQSVDPGAVRIIR